MREHGEPRQQNKELDPSSSRTIRNWVSAIHWESTLAAFTGFHFNDWYTHGGYTYITNKEFAHRITIGFVSAGACGIGIGQLIAEFLRN